MNLATLLSSTQKIDLLKKMLLIRGAEEKIVEVYAQQQMRTPTHLSIGQEAVATGICAALHPDDQLFAPHRCHAAYLAKGGDVDAFFAELCGRVTGSNGGRAGSAHLSAPEVGMFSSPILAGLIPVAVGATLSFRLANSQRVAISLFGDAAIEEGTFAESLNFAVLKKLPVVFVCENNLYSTHTPLIDRQPPSPIFERVRLPELPSLQCDGNNVEAVYVAVLQAVERCRRGEGPTFLEFLTYRFREHVGPLYDYDRGYRTKKEVEDWQLRCPVKTYQQKLLQESIIQPSEVLQIEQRISHECQGAFEKALNAPWPESANLAQGVY